MKLLIGGSPCTYWSIAQTKNRETEASGMGWELFKNFLIARDKYKPDYFLYENNKSMSPAIRAQITKEFGFEPVMIDSALVSAQSRKRLYWLGRREPDGTYSRVNVELPEDRGIILRDILETGVAFREKAYAMLSTTGGATAEDMICRRQSQSMLPSAERRMPLRRSIPALARQICCVVAELICETPDGQLQLLAMGEEPIPLNITQDGKAQCLRATCHKDGIRNMIANEVDKRTCVACPVRIPEYGIEHKSRPVSASYAYKGCGEGSLKCDAFPDNPNKQVFDYVAEPMRIGTIEHAGGVEHDSQQYRVYGPDGKSVTLCGAGGGIGAKTGLYAVQICRNQCVSGRQQNWDMRKSCQGNVWICPCCPARQGGADE